MSLMKSRLMIICIICGALLTIIALSQSAYDGECASLGCSDSGRDPMAKLDEIGNPTASQEQTSAKWPEKSRTLRWNMSASGFEDDENKTYKTPQNDEASNTTQNATSVKAAEDPVSLMRSDEAKAILAPLDSVTDEDILLDVSENATAHISGSLAIPYQKFMQNGSLRSVAEIAEILGHAGISQNDSMVIYGECLPCGGGPSASAYVYWMMKSLGHKHVKVLNGYVQDWKERGLPTSSMAIVRPATNYTPAFTDQFIANYSFVKSGFPQVIDARTVQVFKAGSIPNAISIPYESVLDGDKIKSEYELEKNFSILNKEQPAVVFTNTGFKASVVWLALELMGFDARLYSYGDWIINQADEQKTSDPKR